MKRRPGRALCLFDERTRRAVMAEADGLIVRKSEAGASPAP
jgi:hypothetical protein